ncbi:MAG: S41 family peptidase [Flavobacteriales bacterium]
MTWRTWLACSLCIAMQVLQAQRIELVRTLTPEQSQADLEILASLLEQVHPDPYRYTSKGELDRMVDRVRDSLALPLTVASFRASLAPVFHAIGDARFQLEHPETDAAAQLLPVKVLVQGEKVLVVDETKGFRSLPIGSSIISINGIPIGTVLERMGANVVADGHNSTLREAIIGSRFSEFYHGYVEQSSTFNIEYFDPQGIRNELLVMGLTRDEVVRSQKPGGVQLAPWTSTIHPDQDALWLTLSTLEQEELDKADLDPAKYLRALLKEMKRKGLRDLVIDVRNADGRELASAELLFSFIAKEPFRVVQDMSVRSMEPPATDANVTIPAEFYGSLAGLFLPQGSGAYHVRADDHRLEQLTPMKRAFAGKVHVVCNGGTRGAAAAFVMLAKRSNRARIVGEEVGANSGSFTGGRALDVELPNSGFRISIPLVRYVPDGVSNAPLDRGEMPHHTVVQRAEDLAKGRDTVKGALLQFFNEMQ